MVENKNFIPIQPSDNSLTSRVLAWDLMTRINPGRFWKRIRKHSRMSRKPTLGEIEEATKLRDEQKKTSTTHPRQKNHWEY
ncbi:MAG: hypothetical protein ACI83D_000023 [Planctomycetota bacterium]|jgi:hypothetical protein